MKYPFSLVLFLVVSLIHAQEAQLILSPSIDLVIKAEDNLASGASLGSSGEISLKLFLGPIGVDARLGLTSQPDIVIPPISFGGYSAQKYSLGAAFQWLLCDPWQLSFSALWGNTFGTYNNTVIQFYLPSFALEPGLAYKKNHWLLGLSLPVETYFPRDIDYGWTLGLKANLGVYY